MSESAPERSGGGNVFTRKIGPLPMWAWMGIVALVAVLYYLYQKNQSGNTSGATSSPSTVNTPGGVDSSLVPQFVNQTYTNVQPPAAPNVTVNNTVPTTSGTGTTTTPAATPLNEILNQGHSVSTNPNSPVIGWNIAQKSPNATQIKLTINGPGQKNTVMYVPASATQATLPKLQPGHTYTVGIAPIDAQGQAVGGPGNIDIVTAKA